MNETCPLCTEGWTRCVHFVREGGGVAPATRTRGASLGPGRPRACTRRASQARRHPCRCCAPRGKAAHKVRAPTHPAGAGKHAVSAARGAAGLAGYPRRAAQAPPPPRFRGCGQRRGRAAHSSRRRASERMPRWERSEQLHGEASLPLCCSAGTCVPHAGKAAKGGSPQADWPLGVDCIIS